MNEKLSISNCTYNEDYIAPKIEVVIISLGENIFAGSGDELPDSFGEDW